MQVAALGETGLPLANRLTTLVLQLLANIFEHGRHGRELHTIPIQQFRRYYRRHPRIIQAAEAIPEGVFENNLSHLRNLYNGYLEFNPVGPSWELAENDLDFLHQTDM